MSGLRLITGNGVFVGLGFPSLRFLSTKGTNIDIFGAFLVNNQRFEPAILMIPDSGSSSPPSEEGVVTPAYDGINQTQPRLQSDGPIIDKLQHLASFLLIRGPFAWLGWAWLGCGNFPYRPPCDPPPSPPFSAWLAYKALHTTESLHIKHSKYENSAYIPYSLESVMQIRVI